MVGRVAQGDRASRSPGLSEALLEHVPAALLGLGLVALALFAYWAPGNERFYNHFVWQALAFLDGRAAIDWPVGPGAGSAGNYFFQDVLPVFDASGQQTGRALIPFPPLPAVFLLPFVAIWGVATDERAISVVLGAVDVGLCWWALGRLRVSPSIRLAVTVFFAFGTVFWYAAQLGTTWFFAHVVALAPLLLAVGIALGGDRGAVDEDAEQPPARALLERLAELASPLGIVDGRQFLAGFLFGLACTARLTIAFGAPFFMLVGSGGTWVRRSVSAGLGAAIPIAGLLAYNVATTGHLLHPGYDYLYRIEAQGYPGLHYNVAWGIEDIRYLPQNIGIMFGSLPALFPARIPSSVTAGAALCLPPDTIRGLFDLQCPIALPRDVGMSILLTSPAYLLAVPALRWLRRNRLVAGSALAVVLIAIVNLMHFSQGWVQFGYRFSNDFVVFALPLIAVALARRGGVGLLGGWLIAASVAIEFWGVTWGNLLGW